MTDEPRDESQSSWLLEPPGEGEVHLAVAIGSDVELSPDARAALERLLSSLQAAEAAEVLLGEEQVKPCPAQRTCAPYRSCRVLTSSPTCLVFVHCKIAGADF